ncbi:SDR family oxidoreductase [Scytonema sp. NUACC26]|uniref:SDR family oxidoreductase n=1 Tax=Scytonema sp. NUACC26 TaxID=3140176 RepID=UPI0034DBDBCA
MNVTLENQNIVIIGGSSGVGLAVAKLVAAAGAKLTLASRSRDRLEKAAHEINSDVQIGIINTLDENSVKDFFANLNDIDHLLNFAGDSMGGGVLTTDIATARNAMESKFWGQFYVGRYGGPRIKSSGGSLTFTSGSGPRPHQAIATVAANAGVSLLAESLAKELAPVRVNVVAPYYIDSPMWAGMVDEERQQLFERVGKQLPIGRVATIDDVAPIYLHVLQSSYITGITIPVNGGALLQTVE